jgi:hypothetical protein
MEVFDYVCDHVSWWFWLVAFVVFCILLLREKPEPLDPRDADMRVD